MQKVFCALLFFCCSQVVANELDAPLQSFKTLYQARFGEVSDCHSEAMFKICAQQLRNDGNSPFVLHHGYKTEKVAVLFHGLSDSPFYMQPIAQHLYGMGLNVVVALLPAHGLKDAKDVMLDRELSAMWSSHVQDVMALAPQFGDKVTMGGFSTGGALSVQYTFDNRDRVDGLMLFSGALALAGNAESLSKIWGVQWLARILDRDYASQGPNPYKYPSVANSAGLELMEVISDIRSKVEEGRTLTLPIYVVHSEADMTTPIEGVQTLLESTEGVNTVFYINEKQNVCHADVVLNLQQASKIRIDNDDVNPLESCAVPQANPVFRQMVNLLSIYISGV